MKNGSSTDKILPRCRVAIGPRRPQYLHEVELDRMMMVSLSSRARSLRSTIASTRARPWPAEA